MHGCYRCLPVISEQRPWKRDERFSKSDAVDSEMHIVLDDGVYVVWHGGMNLLGKADIYDNLIRVENEQAAAELLEMTEQMGNRSV